MDTAELKGLLEKATKGLWYAGRVEVNSATAGHLQPYSPWIHDGGPRLVQVGRSIAIHADDMALIAALRNNAEELIASAERVKVLEEKLADEKARAEHHKAAHQSIKGRATTQHGMEMEARVSQLLDRVARLEAALREMLFAVGNMENMDEADGDDFMQAEAQLVNAESAARQALGGAK